MKMTSQLVTLVLAVFICSAAVVYSQTSLPTVPATEPITTPRPAVVTTPPPVDNGTPAPPANGTDAPAPVVTDEPMTSAKNDDDDGMTDDGDTDGKKGHDEDEEEEEGGGGLRRGDIALAILATILVVAVICTFTGLCYWKYKGNSYVTVTADTTYRQ